jgi:hypothetical protein
MKNVAKVSSYITKQNKGNTRVVVEHVVTYVFRHHNMETFKKDEKFGVHVSYRWFRSWFYYMFADCCLSLFTQEVVYYSA